VRTAIIALTALSLGGCATVMEGTGQSVAVATNPPGATCSIDREGVRLGQVASTPGSIHIDKSGKDLQVSCSKDGYRPATIAQSPHFTGTTFGNILIGGGIGAIVDASTGANYEYPAQISMDLVPLHPAPGAPIASVMPQSAFSPPR